MTQKRVSFASTDGVELEGEVDAPETASATVVVCHAHPRLQGTMKSPLLIAIAEDCVRRGFGAVRFNFRGVGNSTGVGTDGTAEVADALGALAFAREKLVEPVALVGWSFGGAVAAHATARDGDVGACVLVAPAIKQRPDMTAGLPSARELGLDVPVLVVCGSNDKVVSPDDCRAWAEDAPTADYREIKAANHFFWAKYDALTETVGEFLQDNLIRKEE